MSLSDGFSGGGGGGGGSLPRLRDVLRRQRRDSDPSIDVPDLNFTYDDSDTLFNELSELYAYSEVHEFQLARESFDKTLSLKFPHSNWLNLTRTQQRTLLYYLIEKCEVVSHSERLDAARSLLYLAHGNYMYGVDEQDIAQYSRANVLLMIEAGVFPAIVQLLALEKERERDQYENTKNKITIADNVSLRVTLSVLYVMIEVARREDKFDLPAETQLRERFLIDLRNPVHGEDNLTSFLFQMLLYFCNGSMPHYPVRKILLVIWKSILASLGGVEKLKELKEEARVKAGLPHTFDETKPAQPLVIPTAAFDPRGYAPPPPRDSSLLSGLLSRPHSMVSNQDNVTDWGEQKGLDFCPKARLQDIEGFIELCRSKFGCYESPGLTGSDPLSCDISSLPAPTQESIKVLRQHVYIPLSDVQIKKVEENERLQSLNKPVEVEERDTPTERLYKSILPNLPQYMIAILKVLLAAAPAARARSESVNIFVDVISSDTPANMIESAQNTLDINRHKEIIVKAISATLFLLLKHFKINHIYQFEYVSQHLVFANCLPLILKFLNQNLSQYVTARNNFPALNFPDCVLVPPESSIAVDIPEALPSDSSYCWRNLFSCINVVRILQKLTKWKHSRIVMLVVFRSAPILKRTLKVHHPLVHRYVLKLLKVQAKYLGRNWRKNNMRTISMIYRHVRHHFQDDWAFGNDLDAKPWDFQTEEFTLKNQIERFNVFYYDNEGQRNPNPFGVELRPADTNYLSVLGKPVELSETWKDNYEKWVEVEVIQHERDWDRLLDGSQCHHLTVKTVHC